MAGERAIDLSPALALFMWRHSERDRASDELLRLETALAASAPGGLQEGNKIFRDHARALRAAASLDGEEKPEEAPAGPVWPPPRKPKPKKN